MGSHYDGRAGTQKITDHAIYHAHAICIQPRVWFVHQYQLEGAEPKGRQRQPAAHARGVGANALISCFQETCFVQQVVNSVGLGLDARQARSKTQILSGGEIVVQRSPGRYIANTLTNPVGAAVEGKAANRTGSGGWPQKGSYEPHEGRLTSAVCAGKYSGTTRRDREVESPKDPFPAKATMNVPQFDGGLLRANLRSSVGSCPSRLLLRTASLGEHSEVVADWTTAWALSVAQSDYTAARRIIGSRL